ncbi:allophanate hydrolase family protein [Pseudooceanicola batsensis HTCC2597]|uniref:Allophanate hydrolase family protein n=1 Tax=Pseudooceanicola batsensis (strain ATCC BAA-863 / DSM 15984 / KCTC 12145 / HTCC2597) TaxID=252305 RepID=A3TUY7_PSEBH|nr:carboxyltransferase domain-containing protein [Pseudooceanicola batsensis]EAQ04333.1 allophanate hydrolase family protein [Pseudooceanicola batsensis HTCC2597]
MMTDTIRPEILPHGQDGLSLRLGLTPAEQTIGAVMALREALEQTPPDGTEEIAGSLTSVYLRFDPARTTRDAVVASARAVADRTDLDAAALPAPHRRWTIPVVIGGAHGPQFGEMAGAAGLSEAAAREALLTAKLRVLAIGFAPGLPYMGLLPPEWDVPRLRDLTPNVPRGALVAAVRQVILFTNATPTGWRHVGMSAFPGFRPDRDPASPLRAGDEVRLAAMTPADLEALERDDPDGLGGARCETLR